MQMGDPFMLLSRSRCESEDGSVAVDCCWIAKIGVEDHKHRLRCFRSGVPWCAIARDHPLQALLTGMASGASVISEWVEHVTLFEGLSLFKHVSSILEQFFISSFSARG